MEAMYFEDTEDLPDYYRHLDDIDDGRSAVAGGGGDGDEEPQYSVTSGETLVCSRGHRSTMSLRTSQGGVICLLCFSNLVGDPLSPSLHVSYALSQLSRALAQPPCLSSLLAFHPRLLVSPLVRALASFEDEAIARQVLDLIAILCDSADETVRGDFVARVSDQLSSGALAWSRRQVYTLHCFGVLLKCENDSPYAHIKDRYDVISNLVEGLRLPSDEIRGELLFVLYRLAVLYYGHEEDGTDMFSTFCPKLLHLLLDALIKIQSDDVRLNCVALLTVLAQRGFLENAYAVNTTSTHTYEESLTRETESGTDGSPLSVLFAEAIKGPLLSTDSQVQTSTLNLLFYYMSWEGTSSENIQVLVDENIADYVFEILRLSECRDPVVISCLQVLDLLSTAKLVFKQRLVVGFTSLIPVLQYVAEVPCHPVQSQTLRLIWNCVCDCPGVPSASQIKELIVVLTRMLEKHADGEIGMLPETFMLICSTLVSLLKSPSSLGTCGFKEALQQAVLSCLSVSENNSCQLLQSLHLLKEVYVKSCEDDSPESSNMEVRNYILDVCTIHLLPWFVSFFKEIEEEVVLGLLETFHSIFLWDSNEQASKFAENLVSSSWFSLSFACLGLFPTEVMKEKVYLILGSVVDLLLGNNSGQSIKVTALCLPYDPIDLLFLLGQKSSYNLEVSSSQSAILTILYASSLYDERLADDKLVLASLEDYIITNASDFGHGETGSSSVMRLLYLYGFYRGLAKVSYQIPYNPEAERILFQLVNKYEWDLVSAKIHPISLKWLFQQDRFCEPLSDQIMKVSLSSTLYSSETNSRENHSCIVSVQAIAELVASGDNYGARLLVCLLMKLIKEEVQESYLIYLVNLLTLVVNNCPAASDELCLNNIGNAIHSFFTEKIHKLASELSKPFLVLIFNLLSSVHSETLSDDEIWAAVIMKLMEYILAEDAGRWTYDNILGIGILSLVLYHSTNNKLTEASKAILFNPSLASTIDCMIQDACQKGPALIEHDEGTSYGDRLVFALLLNYFSLRSLCAVLPGSVDWQSFFDPPDRTQELSVIGIPCHDLCRLMYYGPPLVKLVASHSLLELFSRISDQINTEHEEPKCTLEYLASLITVLQGFVFYNDHRVALNCSVCVSSIFGWEMLNAPGSDVTGKNNWSRLIIEELAVSLSAPSLSSKSLINQHKPAIYIAIAMLKLANVPGWMRSVFDEPCISGMIENLTAGNVASEIVVLFRELLSCGFLKPEQIESLNRVFKAWRKRLHTNSAGGCVDELLEKAVLKSGDLGEVCAYFICLMSLQGRDLDHLSFGNTNLSEEIELFFGCSTLEEES